MRAFIAVVLFVAGLTLGLIGYATLDPSRFAIEADTQGKLVVAVGAIVTGLLAVVAAYVGGSMAQRGSREAAAIAAEVARTEGEAARKDARRQAVIDRQRYLRSLITAQSNRHAREIQMQVARRRELAGHPYEPLPQVSKTTEIEDGVVELYTLGFQRTADVAQALFNVLLQLDAFCFVAPPESTAQPIPALSDELVLDMVAWSEVERQVRTDLMQVGLTDQGAPELTLGGTLEPNYLEGRFKRARDMVAASAPPTIASSLSIRGSSATYPGPGQ